MYAVNCHNRNGCFINTVLLFCKNIIWLAANYTMLVVIIHSCKHLALLISSKWSAPQIVDSMKPWMFNKLKIKDKNKIICYPSETRIVSWCDKNIHHITP